MRCIAPSQTLVALLGAPVSLSCNCYHWAALRRVWLVDVHGPSRHDKLTTPDSVQRARHSLHGTNHPSPVCVATMATRMRGVPSGPPDTVVRACGQAFYHALGDPDRETCTKFHRVAKLLWPKHVVDVQCGGTFTVVRTCTSMCGPGCGSWAGAGVLRLTSVRAGVVLVRMLI